MATTNSSHKNHHHRPKFLYLDALDHRSTNPPDNNEDSIFYDIWNTNDIKRETSRKLPLKPHKCHTRQIPVTGKSLPINIPDWSKIMTDCDQFEDDDNDDDWLPPHEYLARIRSASFSVHEGVGRTLKGRDLSKLRNAIWKQTGFGQD